MGGCSYPELGTGFHGMSVVMEVVTPHPAGFMPRGRGVESSCKSSDQAIVFDEKILLGQGENLLVRSRGSGSSMNFHFH